MGKYIIIVTIMALLLIPSLALAAHNPARVVVAGTGCFTYGDQDTPSAAREKAMSLAKREAVEGYKSFISSNTKLQNMELASDNVEAIASGALYDVVVTSQKEEGRKICVSIKASVDSSEMDALLEKAMTKQPATDPMKEQARQLKGRWEADHEGRSTSTLVSSDAESAIWQYGIKRINDDTYADLGIDIIPTDMKDATLEISIHSENGHPLYLSLYSFVPGYTDADDFDTQVPADLYIPIVKGEQVISVSVSKFQVPGWWRKEYKAKKVQFNPADVRYIEIEAEVDDDLGVVSDRVEIRYLKLK